MLARADVQYSQLTTAAWGQGDTVIEYGYDNNGSMTNKTTTDSSTSYTTETVVYEYNLQNRLSKVTTTPYVDNIAQTPEVVEYKYNPQGVRTQKIEDFGSTPIVTDYLVDPSNHTGYAQVLQETVDDGTANWTRIQYTIGDDVLAQTHLTSANSGVDWTTGDTEYLLYDGHGSTRQLVNNTGAIVSGQQYNYDAYGVMLSDSTASGADIASSAATNLLYSGEQYDSNLDQYYLRARYYNPANGLFNRVDPYSGNNHDPQSLHKYAYVHNNPVNGIDPSGRSFTYTGMLMTMGISGLISSILVGSYGMAKGWSAGKIARAAGYAFLTGAVAGAIAYGAAAGIAALAMTAGVAAGQAAAVGWTTVGLIGGPSSVGLSVINLNEAVENGDNVDRTFAVVNLGLASFGFIASHWSAFNLAASTTAGNLPQVRQNYIAGDAAEVDFIANAQANGLKVVGRRVSVKTPFGRRQIDVVLQDKNGVNYGVEVKSSVGAFNRNDAAARQQFSADRYINQYGAQAIGKNSGLGRIEGTCKILWRPKAE